MTTPQHPHVFPDHLDLIPVPETPEEAAWLLREVPRPSNSDPDASESAPATDELHRRS